MPIDRAEVEGTEDTMGQMISRIEWVKFACRTMCALLILLMLSPVLYSALMPKPVGAQESSEVDASGLPRCSSTAVAQGLRDAAMGYYTTARQAMEDEYATEKRRQARNPLKESNVEQTYCLADLEAYFDTVRLLLIGAGYIDAALAALAYIFDRICNWVVESILATVNSVLDRICIDISYPSFSLDLPSIDRTTCSGTPLSDIMGVRAIPGMSFSSRIPSNLMTSRLSRWADDNGVSNLSYSLGVRGPRF